MPIMKRLIPVLFSGWMFACINVPEIEPARPPDAGTGPTEAPDAGPPPLSDLAVTITSPADVFYSSTEVPITVEVRGGVAESVQLLKDGKALTTLSTPPFQYTWDTTQEAEGRYSLTARAQRGVKRFESVPVAVVVDRTNLQVASRSPANGASNVDYSQPFRVVFTKPVKASTVNDTTVSFAVAGISTDKTLALSSDGMTLTITPKERPNLPATFAFGVSRGVTDLAGNALATPITQSSSPWSFEVPDWYAFGGSLEAVPGTDTQMKDSTMVLDKDGNPIVAWSEQNVPNGKFSLFVYRWDGKAFVRMGYPINGTQNGSAFRVSLALGGDGNPVIAWEESSTVGAAAEEDIYVARWTGTSWSLVGSGYLSAENDARTPTPAHNPSLVAKGNDIYVAWDEANKDKVTNIQVWKSINGGKFFGLGNTHGLVHAVSKSTSATNPSLVVDSHGRAIVAFQEETLEQYSPLNIYVMKHATDDSWAYAVPPFGGNDESGYVSGGLSVTPDQTSAQNCSLGLGANDELFLAWAEESSLNWGQDIHSFKLIGEQSWTRIGSIQNGFSGLSRAAHPIVKISRHGKIFTSWMELSWNDRGPIDNFFVSEWNGTVWVFHPSETEVMPKEHDVVDIAFVVDALERPIVSWLDKGSNVESKSGAYIFIRRKN